ncbi:MAG: acyl transferase [Chitinophagaceae bacterium]
MAAELPKEEELLQKLFHINNDRAFEQVCMEVFEFQYSQNILYRSFCDLQKKSPRWVNSPTDIPFLPISFFKSHKVSITGFNPDKYFESSGTTGSINSRHYVKDLSVYEQSFLNHFQHVYGDPKDYIILALLPSYLQRNNSSLIYMVRKLMDISGHLQNGFYLDEFESLYHALLKLENDKQKVLLIGVTYALLDFAEKYPVKLQHTIVMETGGMKGRREELIRQDVHQQLQVAFGLDAIHSEYGMTELLSQAYAEKKGIFKSPPWMKILIREEDDPQSVIYKKALSGAINIIDLANIFSCSFIAADDRGRLYADGSFEVLGRLDHSDIRGCSLLSL